jgi:hypothetical protein
VKPRDEIVTISNNSSQLLVHVQIHNIRAKSAMVHGSWISRLFNALVSDYA